MTVTIIPMPERYREIPKKYRPGTPPIFTYAEGEKGRSPEDVQLARELWKLLDEESQEWYGRRGIFEGID